MESTGIILIVVLVVVLVYFVMVYNQLVQVRNNVSKAWASLDAVLKHRHDELLKLVETCRQHVGFEQDTLSRIMQARSQGVEARMQRDVAALGQAEGMLRADLGRLFAVAEGRPELRANETFQHLRERIAALEN
jgi:LemA protein